MRVEQKCSLLPVFWKSLTEVAYDEEGVQGRPGRSVRLVVHQRVFGEFGQGLQFEINVQLWPEQVVAVE